MKNIIYKRSNSITKDELLDVFEYVNMSMSPYIDYYTYKEYEKASNLGRFSYSRHTEILIKDQVIVNALCRPNGLMVYIGKEYIVSLNILNEIFGDDLRIGVMIP